MKRQLGLKEGIPLAMGSIIGSGILFLPSLTYKTAENDILVVWILATLMCIPLLIIFKDMSLKITDASGIKGYIELGLGKSTADIIPLLLIATVSIGMTAVQGADKHLLLHIKFR